MALPEASPSAKLIGVREGCSVDVFFARGMRVYDP
jgi:hypothetical protein